MPRFYRLRFALSLFVLSFALLLAVGCGSSQSTADTTGDAAAEAEEPAPEIDPKKGMTQEQIATMYQGQPDQVVTNSDGTKTWRYHMNAGERWIPYNFGYEPEYHVIHFDKDGRVESYSLAE